MDLFSNRKRSFASFRMAPVADYCPAAPVYCNNAGLTEMPSSSARVNSQGHIDSAVTLLCREMHLLSC